MAICTCKYNSDTNHYNMQTTDCNTQFYKPSHVLLAYGRTGRQADTKCENVARRMSGTDWNARICLHRCSMRPELHLPLCHNVTVLVVTEHCCCCAAAMNMAYDLQVWQGWCAILHQHQDSHNKLEGC